MTATPVTAGPTVWRPGDPVGGRRFVTTGPVRLESGEVLPSVTIAFESWGTLSPSGDNAVLVEHALTGDSHVVGDAGPAHPSPGWWPGLIGPGAPLDTDRWFVVASNVLGGCQGTHRPVVGRPGRTAVGEPVPVRHDPRPGHRGGRARRRARRRPVARRARRVDGWHARPGVGGRPPRARRAGPRPRDDALRHRRPGRLVPAAAARHPLRPGVPRRRLLRHRTGAAHRHGHRPADRPHHLPPRGRARRALRPATRGPARTRSAVGDASTSRATSTTTPPSSPHASTRTATSSSPRR